MGYVVEFSGVSEESQTSASNATCAISPLAQEDDVAVAFLVRVNGTSATTPTGWQSITTEDSNISIFYKNQGATPDTSVSIPTTSTNHLITTFLVRGCDVSTSTSAYDSGSYTSTNNSTAQVIASPSITPSNTNSTIIYGMGEPSGQGMLPQHGGKYIGGLRGASVTGMVVESFAPTTSATPTYDWERNHTSLTGINAVFTFAMVDAGNSELKAYVDWDTNPLVTPIHYMGYNGEGGNLSTTAVYNPTTEIPSITDGNSNSVSTVFDTILSQGNIVQPGFYSANVLTNSAAPSITGSVISSLPSITGKNLSFNMKFRLTGPISTYNLIGAYFGLSDQTNTRIWMVGGSDTSPNITEGLFPVIIDPDGGFEWEDIGTVTIANSDTLVWGFNKNSTDNENLYMSPVVLTEDIILEGGTSACPGSMDDLRQIVQLNRLNTVLNQGGQTDAQFICFQNIEIQTDYWDGSTQSVSYPQAYDEAGGYVQAQIADGSLSFFINIVNDYIISYLSS